MEKRQTGLSFLPVILLTFFLVSCARRQEMSPTVITPSQTPTLQAPTAFNTPTPPTPRIIRLTANEERAVRSGASFQIDSPIDPGDQLNLSLVVAGVDKGIIEVLDESHEFTTATGQSTQIEMGGIRVPRELSEPSLRLTLRSGGQVVNYAIEFTPGPNWAPEPQLEDVAYEVGQEAIIKFVDLNDDQVELIAFDQVKGLGDRYTGPDYVTSQPLRRIERQNGAIVLVADFPGRYRLRLQASDGQNEVERYLDIDVGWPTGANPFEIRGVAIDTWGPPAWNDLEYVRTLLDVALDHGANFIQLAPYWHVPNGPTSSTIVPCYDSPIGRTHCTTPQDEELVAWIEYAHDIGLRVLLKPHLIGGEFDEGTSSYDFESWEIKPSDPDRWFEEYKIFITHYAAIAEEHDVEMFAVGNELNGTQLMQSRWKDVIAEVAQTYSGPLTYSDVLLWQSWAGQVMFWDDIDYIGIPYYFNGSIGDPSPSISEMKSEIARVQQTNLARAMRQFDNQLIASEFGRPNFDGTNYDPWTWSNVQDNQEVVDYVEAGMQTMVDLGERFQGVFIWKLWPREEVYDVDWDFRSKPLSQAIKLWYTD